MKVDYLIAEIGSTTTVVSGFILKDESIEMVGQGKSYTTVLEGDVTIGLKRAISEIENNYEIENNSKESLTWDKFLASSSAAGGLRVTVHGLVLDMTVKASKEAALGAGCNIKFVTAGKIKKSDIKKIKEIDPNLIMIAGGTDYGERETSLANAEIIKNENLNKPIIYCGNISNIEDIKEIFLEDELYIVDNVYPRIDELNVEPTRRVIQGAFEKNIVKAPGMSKIKEMVNGIIMPTPGAVMESAKLLYEILGDLIVIDVGGATTDIHSVTEGSSEIMDILVAPEPKAKRTVEGDLGVYINSENILKLLEESGSSYEKVETLRKNIKAIPQNEEEYYASNILTKKAAEVALNRHVGYLKRVYGGSKNFIAYGKDLSKVKYIIGTGGALIKLKEGKEILESLKYSKEDITMLPKKETKVIIDEMYIMATAGLLSKVNKEAAIMLLRKSLKI